MANEQIWKDRAELHLMRTQLDVVYAEMDLFDIPSADRKRVNAMHDAKGHLHKTIMALFDVQPDFPKKEKSKSDKS